MAMKKRYMQTMAWVLSAVTLASGFTPIPVRAEPAGGDEGVANVSYTNPEGWRGQVLKVNGEPFWYNGIQIRIDKLIDDPAYACDEETLQQLFDKAAADGFTVANSQIRWTDIQPNHLIRAVDTSYIYGGTNQYTVYAGTGGTHVRYNTDESKQALGYIKFDVSEMKDGSENRDEDGAKIRLCNRDVVSKRKVELYAVKGDWDRSTLTWTNAPGRGENYTVDGKLVSASLSYDLVENASDKRYYDFDISEFYRSDEWGDYIQADGTMSFVIRDVSGSSSETLVNFGDFDDSNLNGKNGIPQLIYAHADEFDYEYLDKAIDYARNAGLKFEILWFGTDTCSLSTDTRVPVWVYTYQKTIGTDGNPLLKKSDSLTGYYNYIMCKNDEALREKEALALKNVYDHIASRGDDVVIGCQVSNEPGVGLLHGSKKTAHCMCSDCVQKQETLGVSDAQFREITMWEYNENLSRAVKESAYPVWTRMNLAESADVEGVAYNELMRATSGTHLDYIGIDHYRHSPTQLAMEGVPGQQFAQGENIPMLMELGQKDARDAGLFLAEDTLACLSGGAYVTIYDASSPDGCEIYKYNQSTKTFTNYAQIDNLVSTNLMLKKIGYDLAIRYPGQLGGSHLVYFNPTSSVAGKSLRKSDVVGGNKGVTYYTENNGVGIAVNKNDAEIALLTAKPGRFSIDNIPSVDAIVSAELGYYDEMDQWVRESDFSGISEEDGKAMVDVPNFGCVRLVLDEEMLAETEPVIDFKTEAELTSYHAADGLTTEVWNDGASAGGWLKVHAKTDGDYVVIPVTVPTAGLYTIETCYRNGKDRGTVQLSVNERVSETPIDMYASSSSFKSSTISGVFLEEGSNEIVYTISGKNSASTGYIIGLDYLQLTRTGSYVDFSKLELLYNEYKDLEQGDYTDVSWQNLQSELQKTKALMEREGVVQDDIDNQKNLLEIAVNNLLVNTDKTKEELDEELRILIEEAESELTRNDVDYSDEAKTQLQGEINTARALLGDPAYTPPQLVRIIANLQAALDEFIGSAATGLTRMIDENFDEAEGTFGFTNDAEIVNGELVLMQNITNASGGETSIKKFSSEIMGQSVVELRFDWTSAAIGNQGKTGIDFRDSYGNLLLALQTQLDGGKIRHSAMGAAHDSSNTGAEPTWKEIKPLAVGETYQVWMRADFDQQTVSYSITKAADGSVLVKVEDAATNAVNLAKMVANNFWTKKSDGTSYAAPHRIDNFKLYASDDAGELPLTGKTMITFGDSIVAGHMYLKAGFGEFLAEKEGMSVLTKYAVNGAGISAIYEQVMGAAADGHNPDFVVFDGGINDAYDTTVLGTSEDDTEAETFAGRFRKALAAMQENWPDAKVVYVAVHKTNSRDIEIQQQLYDLEMAICQDMGITVADIYASELDATSQAIRDKYAFGALVNGIPNGYVQNTTYSGTHPNFLAIKDYYVPIVSDVLRSSDQHYVTQRITVTSSPIKTVYDAGEEFDAAGLTVTAKQKTNWGEQTREITVAPGKLSYDYDFSATGETLVAITFSEDGQNFTAEIPVMVMNLMIDEAFEDSEDNFGFDDHAVVEDGVLKLTRAMANETTAVKLFDNDIADQQAVALHFEWSPAGIQTKGKSGVEFRDSDGKLIFAIQGEMEKKEVRYSVSGTAHDSSTTKPEPTFTKIDEMLVAGAVYQVWVQVDFELNTMSYSIIKADGTILATAKDITTNASDLSKMVASNYWSVSSAGVQYSPVQVIDSFKVYGLGETTAGADKEALITLLEEANEKLEKTELYTADTLAVLQEAILAAQQVVDDHLAGQGNVDAQVEALQNAIDDLKILDSLYYTERIEVTRLPNKTEYEVNEVFDSTGMTVTAFENSEVAEAEPRERVLEAGEYQLDYDFSILGTAEVTVSYTAEDIDGNQQVFNDSFEVMVVDEITGDYYTYKIKVTRKPDKMTYEPGDSFDAAGMKVTAYQKATSSDATPSDAAAAKEILLEEDDYDVEYNFDSVGTAEVTVIYYEANEEGDEVEFTDTFTVDVVEEDIWDYYTSKIKVKRLPDKTEYQINEELDSRGLNVVAYETATPSNAGSREKVLTEDDYELDYDFSVSGIRKVTVTYYAENADGEEQRFRDSFTVKVKASEAEKTLTSIEVVSKPDKTVYYRNEAFDNAGLVVKAVYNDGTFKIIDGYKLEVSEFMAYGNYKITITFEGKVAVFEVSVIRRSSGSSGGSSRSVTTSDQNLAGTWKQNENGWWYELNRGGYAASQWAMINNKWYLFGTDGYMLTGWQFQDDKWYLLNQDGVMHADTWAFINGKWYFFTENGRMRQNEWYLDNGNWYYFGADGDMLFNQVTPDGYRLDSEGKWVS